MKNLSKRNIAYTEFYKHENFVRPTVAISACLNGQRVRYDAKHQILTRRAELSSHLHFLDVCPEVSAGMSIPRPAIQLVKINSQIRALGRDDPTLDVTDALLKQRNEDLLRLHQQKICAYIFKSRSPSCGIGSTPIYGDSGQQLKLSNGLQADLFMNSMPWIVLRDETQLQTPEQCQQFIFICFLMNELQTAIELDRVSSFKNHCIHMLKLTKKETKNLFFSDNTPIEDKLYQTRFKHAIETLLTAKPANNLIK